MAEWHLAPDYIVNNWTDELFALMVTKLAERKKRETEAIPPPKPDNKNMSVEAFVKTRGIQVKHSSTSSL